MMEQQDHPAKKEELVVVVDATTVPLHGLRPVIKIKISILNHIESYFL